IVARHAQEWNMSKGTPAEFQRLSTLLDGYCREASRAPASVERSIQFGADALDNGADKLVALSREFVAAGATHLIYTCPIPYSAAGGRRGWGGGVGTPRGGGGPRPSGGGPRFSGAAAPPGGGPPPGRAPLFAGAAWGPPR